MIFRHLLLTLAVVLFIPSQIFWLWQLRGLGIRFIRRRSVRRWLGWAGIGVYLALLAFNVLWPKTAPEAAHLTLAAALLEAPFRLWMLASLLGFVVFFALYLCICLVRAVFWAYRKLLPPSDLGREPLLSPGRRHFLTQAAVAVSATPFAACAYGLLYERTEIETTHLRIMLRRLPRAFDGFRIAQISDIHVGPFMPAVDIRRCVAMVNQLKPDLVALTGDFVTWEASPEAAVVEALSGLKAPYGIFGCLGNHEAWAHVEDSITRLFAERGTKMLRLENAAIESAGERLNLIGVDYQTRGRFGPPREGIVGKYLEGVEPLMLPGAVNILLSHNPNTFDRAAELGIDLSLAGHTHGGQITLEYISPDLSPARLITAYVRGWFQKGESQLYVNRGIGTIFAPVRVGAPPEITIYELKRG
ncbi:MAG: metallophosphoesterase [Terriglobia bacterium]|jgi:predicted MPP superfamily phosphohydrolase